MKPVPKCECGTCRLCKNRAANRAYRARNPGKETKSRRERSKRWRENNREAYREVQRRKRLKGAGCIDAARFARVKEASEGRCEICRREVEGIELCSDHCHTTKMLRGVLCHNCNRGIGFLQDDPELLEVAAEYIRRYWLEHLRA